MLHMISHAIACKNHSKVYLTYSKFYSYDVHIEVDNVKNNIKAYRKNQGYSQDKLADILSVSRQTIISIEKGKYNPSLPLALMMAGIFDTTVEQLFRLEASDYKS